MGTMSTETGVNSSLVAIVVIELGNQGARCTWRIHGTKSRSMIEMNGGPLMVAASPPSGNTGGKTQWFLLRSVQLRLHNHLFGTTLPTLSLSIPALNIVPTF